MRRAVLLSIFLMAGFTAVASADDYRQYSPYTHYPYYPKGWYSPNGGHWVQWHGLREPWTPPSATIWEQGCGQHAAPFNCNGPTVPLAQPGCPPAIVGHDIEVNAPKSCWGSWQCSLKWLRCNKSKCD